MAKLAVRSYTTNTSLLIGGRLLISRLVACSARIVADRQTDKQTDTQNDYCNPRCACAPRVNYMAGNNIIIRSTCY